MLTCTIRRTPASLAAPMRVWLFATARSNVMSPCGNRTQYVLYTVVAPRRCPASFRGSSKWNEATLTRSPNGVRAVRVAGERLHAPAGLQQASGDVPARVAECPRYDVNLGHRDLAGSSHRLELRDVVILVLEPGPHERHRSPLCPTG
jgi:hypothetical protein